MTNPPLPYSRIRIRKPVVRITEHDIDDMLEKLLRQQASWSPVKRGALPGDKITSRYTGWIGDRKVIDSGQKPVSFILGSNQLPKKVQESIIGTRSGDCVHASMKHRINDGNPELAGNRVNYECHVLDVLEEKIPPLDKSFARGHGVTNGSLKSLRKQVASIMRHQIDNLVRRMVRQQLIDGLLYLDQSAASGNLHNKQDKVFARQRISPGNDSITCKEVDSCSTRAPFDRQHALSQILRRIIRENSITVDQNKVGAAIDAIAAATDNPEETANRYHNNQELFSKVEASVLENQVLEFVLEHAKVKEASASYGKLFRDFHGDGSAEAGAISARLADVPIIELTPEKKCDFCARSCCTYITQKIPTPRTKEDFSHLLWQVSHQQVEAYKDNEGWHLMFRSKCEHLLQDGRCGNYEHRMQVCRKYSNTYCEFDASAEEGFELDFKDYDALLAYCRRRFPRWEY